jgi:serine/threonine-protein kinase
MTAERENEIERLYHAALARRPEERAAFLRDACGGDDALPREVASLLAHGEAAEEFLEAPALDVLARIADGASPLTPSSGACGSDRPGTFAPGARFGRYQIVSVIGAGGMGEVYRARDTALNRDVAVKVLPDRFSGNAERVARLEREAQVLASLNHPNIATIHGIEYVEGIAALVLEFVEGTTLAERLNRGPLPVDEALDIAYQIADGLEAAHDRGIVHRDLKPANVMVTREGRVKLLDFGVAKAFDVPNAASPGRSATQASGDTHAGLVPGTAAYMSPEQARGDIVDRRSDIWAFGCVLYEMLTGTSPFHGSTVAELLRNVIQGPVDFDALPVETPPSTRRLLRFCLERSLRGRLQHIGDARVEIADTRARLGDDRSSLAKAAEPSPRRRAVWAALAATAIVGAAALGWFLGERRAPPPPRPLLRFSLTPAGTPLTPTGRTIAISADGSRLAYVSGGWLWLRQLKDPEPVRMAGTEGAGGEPFFSPDGEWVAFFDLNTGLRKVPVRGGTPRTIVVNAGRQLGGSWGANDTIVFADGVGLFTIAADGGTSQLLAQPVHERGEARYAWPQILPGGDVVLFTILRDTPDNADVALLNLRTKQQKVLLRGGHAARYVDRGVVIYAAGGQLHGAQLDLSSQTLRREPLTLETVQVAQTIGAATANFDVSRTGTLIYVAPNRRRLRTIVWVDRHGREEATPAPPGYYLYPRMSPDGTRVALDVGAANRDIWVWNLERNLMTRITDGPTEDMMPAWSVDGKRVYFASDPDGVFNVFVRAADGSAPAVRIFRGPDNYMPFSSPDAERLLLFVQGTTAPSGDVGVLHLGEPIRLDPLIRTEHREGNAQVSPDGHWVAYQSDESGQIEIYVRSFPDPDRRKELISAGGGAQALWGPPGSNELYYRTLDGKMRAVSIRLSPDLLVGATTDLFANPRYAHNTVGSWSYAVSPTDRRFLMLKEETAIDADPISVVVNWLKD